MLRYCVLSGRFVLLPKRGNENYPEEKNEHTTELQSYSHIQSDIELRRSLQAFINHYVSRVKILHTTLL